MQAPKLKSLNAALPLLSTVSPRSGTLERKETQTASFHTSVLMLSPG